MKKSQDEASDFAYEWAEYPQIIPQYESLFRRWTAPLPPALYVGARVLDAGCGTGRNSYWVLKYGAGHVVAFDFDPRIVRIARKNLADDRRAEVRQLSVYDLAAESEFDITLCIGVVHHLERPLEAVANLVRATRSGGTILLWVYAREGHTFLKLLLNAVRRVTCRLPPALLDFLLRPFSFLAFVALKSGLGKHPYLENFRGSPFWHVHSVIFDQLLPRVANYWRRSEALGLFEGLAVEDVRIEFVNRGSWTIWARKR